MVWDPTQYLRFADQRVRPGIELLARIPDHSPRRVIDLGSGTGALTQRLADRWPEATVIGVDASPEMLAPARADHPTVEFVRADITDWEPERPVDLVFSNATLHWIDDHPKLFPRLRSWVRSGGVIAVQMPDNWWEPTHRIPAEILADLSWSEAAGDALMQDRLAAPEDYARWLRPGDVDIWRTTYYQHLEGPDPVWEWVTGSLLRPVLETLDATEAERFSLLCRRQYAASYPPGPDGATVLPFSRLFMVAHVP